MATPTPVPSLYDIPVRITRTGNNIEVHPRTVVVCSLDEQIEWVCTTGDLFTVSFVPTAKPFQNPTYNSANPKSGGTTVPPSPNKVYKYTVTIPGCNPKDPDVIVNP